MPSQYSERVAAHYAAYRPPLHLPILRRALVGASVLHTGLDVGCGTGRSSVALAHFCRSVYAIDPSTSMLSQATENSGITYLPGSGEQIPAGIANVDIVTFAGSLSYANIESVASELLRVCSADATVITYDFNVDLSDYLVQHDVLVEKSTSNAYEYDANFSGVEHFVERESQQADIDFTASSLELAHLLLANVDQYQAFADRYATDSPLEPLAADLCPTEKPVELRARIYYSVYSLAR